MAADKQVRRLLRLSTSRSGIGRLRLRRCLWARRREDCPQLPAVGRVAERDRAGAGLADAAGGAEMCDGGRQQSEVNLRAGREAGFFAATVSVGAAGRNLIARIRRPRAATQISLPAGLPTTAVACCAYGRL